jgi:hypothetical protein
LTKSAFEADATPTTVYPALTAIWTAFAPKEEDAPQIRIFLALLDGSGVVEGLPRCKCRTIALIAPYKLEARAAAFSKDASPIWFRND